MRGQKLILNLLPIQAGGGLQNACSFIASGMLAGWEVHARACLRFARRRAQAACRFT